MRKPFRCLLTALLALACFQSSAAVRLPALFSDNMVLQRGSKVRVWGWAEEGERVTVTYRDQKKSTKAKDGKWCVVLSPMRAGGSNIFTVSGRNMIQLTNVVVGEVWLASGQSNMEWPLNKTFEPQNAIDSSANADIRLFSVPNLKANEFARDVNSSWKTAGPETTPTFSAVAYYFGRDLQRALGVPVGLIQSDWGGSPAEVWMSQKALEDNPRYKKEIMDSYVEKERAFQDERARAAANTNTARANPRPPWKPTELYNGMIAPLIPYTIKGAIWYQGESNAGRAEQYRTLFPDLIRSWREDWCQGKFTFLTVQLAPFMAIKDEPSESAWAELREAQLLATQVLPKVGLAVITDVGEQNDIHPQKKEPVGARLAKAARGIAYEEDITYSGPIYRSMKIEGNEVVLSFDHIGRGLEARDGELKGFAIAGVDRKFHWADAVIQGDKVVVSSPKVSMPVAVRYGWADFPVVNLWNKDGLPASPFRTDKFPLTTAKKN